MSTDEDLIREHRAMAAYFRSRRAADALPPSGTAIHSRPGQHDGKSYVVLDDGAARVFAVYRVRNDGKLKELKRWPAEVASR